MWPPTAASHEQAYLSDYASWHDCGYHAQHVNDARLWKHPNPFWGIILIMTARNLISQIKEPEWSNFDSRGH